MTYFAESEIQAVAEVSSTSQNAAQAIAEIDNPQTCAKKSRRVVGLPEKSRRGYEADDLKACNFNCMAATIVDDIRFNTKTHKRPKAASIAYWQAYFKGCSEQKVRTAIRDALASGLLKVTYKMFNGSNTPHYLYVGTGVEFNTPHVEINTTITDSISSSNKDKILKHGFPSEHPAGPCPEINQANSESQKPESTPDDLVEPQKFSTKKKTGPAPKAVTSNGDWQHYNRLAKNHDMEALLKACIDGGLLQPHRTMLSDLDCEFLERIEYALKKSHWCTDSLGDLILAVGKEWGAFCEIFEQLEEKCLHAPTAPNWKFFTRHVLLFLGNPEIEPDPAKQGPSTLAAPTTAKEGDMITIQHQEPKASEPTPAPAAPVVEPVPAHFLTADDYQDCQEPPLSVEKCGYTTDELRAMAFAKEKAKAAAKAARTGANMFQHGKPKGAKASQTAT